VIGNEAAKTVIKGAFGGGKKEGPAAGRNRVDRKGFPGEVGSMGGVKSKDDDESQGADEAGEEEEY